MQSSNTRGITLPSSVVSILQLDEAETMQAAKDDARCFAVFSILPKFKIQWSVFDIMNNLKVEV